MKSFEFFKNLPIDITTTHIAPRLNATSLQQFGLTEKKHYAIAKKLLPKKLEEKKLLEAEFEQALADAYPTSLKKLAVLKNLLDKGVNPNMKFSDNNTALTLTANYGIRTFLLLVRYMRAEDFEAQKNNIIEVLEERLLEPTLGENSWSLPLDIEENITEVLAYLKGESNTIPYIYSSSKERFIQNMKMLEKSLLESAIQSPHSHPASLLGVIFMIRELLSPLNIFDAEYLGEEKNKILAILEKNAHATIKENDPSAALKLDLIANIKNVIEHLKQDHHAETDHLKIPFGFTA